jgi:hypothetical protein
MYPHSKTTGVSTHQFIIYELLFYRAVKPHVRIAGVKG